MLNKKANRLINARNWAVLVKPEQIVHVPRILSVGLLR